MDGKVLSFLVVWCCCIWMIDSAFWDMFRSKGSKYAGYQQINDGYGNQQGNGGYPQQGYNGGGGRQGGGSRIGNTVLSYAGQTAKNIYKAQKTYVEKLFTKNLNDLCVLRGINFHPFIYHPFRYNNDQAILEDIFRRLMVSDHTINAYRGQLRGNQQLGRIRDIKLFIDVLHRNP